jgi:hypothetical protein
MLIVNRKHTHIGVFILLVENYVSYLKHYINNTYP